MNSTRINLRLLQRPLPPHQLELRPLEDKSNPNLIKGVEILVISLS